MSPAEKAGQLIQYFDFRLPAGAEVDPAVPKMRRAKPERWSRHCIEARQRCCCSSLTQTGINRLQRLAIDGNRLDIPLLFGFDVIHGLRTILPVPIAMAASWDVEIIEQVRQWRHGRHAQSASIGLSRQ
jgi:beta-glucosidase